MRRETCLKTILCKPDFRGYCALMATLMSWIALPAMAGTLPHCATIDPRTLPDQASCQRRFVSVGPAALYDLADAQIKAGNFDEAAAALGCAAVQIAGDQDTGAHYERIRRLGVLAYRQERIGDALGHFECALKIAEDRNDRAATAKQLKNKGSALRRLGDYKAGLQALEGSLRILREDGDPGTGAVLNNIADLYRENQEPDLAERYYHEAMEVFRRQGDAVEATHVLDSLSLLALDRGDTKTATRQLETALAAYRQADNREYQLRIYTLLIRTAIAEGDVERAKRYSADGQALADAHKLPIHDEFRLESARVDRISGRIELALVKLRAALAQGPESNTTRAALLHELAVTLEQSGKYSDALTVLRQAHEAEQRDLRAQSDGQLIWLRTRFETAERDRTIATLRQRTLLLWLMIASALVALLGVSILFLRRQQRARLTETANRVRYEEMLARYRREADALSGDRDLLQVLLDSRGEALCLLDADGQVLAVNRAARPLFGPERGPSTGSPLSELLSTEDAAVLAAALERMEDASAQTLTFAAGGGRPALRAELSQWEQGDGLVVMQLEAQTADAAAIADSNDLSAAIPEDSASAERVPARADDPPIEASDTRAAFRRLLVELMLALIDAWERSTGKNRIELAERSRIWSINIDDGRLRARAMERYLSLSKLPQNPRWRDVLRSAYYVMGQCQLDPPVRDALQHRVDAVLAYTRRNALV
jgi:two-component system, sensor histidine kinase ChiS